MTRFVQVRNPRTKHWIKIDTKYGRIVSYKKSSGPYKGIEIKGKEL